MQQFLSELLIPTITAIVASIITFISTRTKEKVEIEGGEIENASKVLDMSERIATRLEAQLIKSDEVIHALKDTIITLQADDSACREKVVSLQMDCEKYERLYLEQKNEVEQLRKDCDALRVLLQEPRQHEN